MSGCACCCRCPRREARRPIEIRERAAGANLSVDVLVDGWHGNVPLPRNYGPSTRTDYLRIGHYEYGVRVVPGATQIHDADIEFRADLSGIS